MRDAARNRQIAATFDFVTMHKIVMVTDMCLPMKVARMYFLDILFERLVHNSSCGRQERRLITCGRTGIVNHTNVCHQSGPMPMLNGHEHVEQ
jgi:hypothetical protein